MNRVSQASRIFASLSPEIDELCSPLKIIGVTKFTYLKRYKDKTEVYLSNNGEWIDYFYENELYKSSVFWYTEQLRHTYHIWPPSDSYPIFEHSWNHFKSGRGVMLIEENKSYTEFFFFKSNSMEWPLVNSYINNLDILHRFILFFKEKAHDLLRKANLYRCRFNDSNDQVIPSFGLTVSETQRKELFRALRTAITLRREEQLHCQIKLSPREIDCAFGTLNHMTASDISDELFISKRTVECHLQSLKEKLNCRSKHELINFLESSGLSKCAQLNK